MPLQALLRRCKMRLKHVLFLCTAALAFFLLVVLILPENGSTFLQWDNRERDALQQDSGIPGEDSFWNSSDEGRDGSVDENEEEVVKPVDYRNGSDVMSTILLGKSRAVCVGGNSSFGEVEDILCMPKPDYDKRMKNPCWWETVTQAPPQGLDVPARSTASLSCLPYFHILCCSKSGTTDMYRRISMHPDIVPNFGMFGKERLFWSWAKYGYRNRRDKGDPVPFYKYIKGFGILARYLEKAALTNPKDLKRFITLDGSPPDMWDLRGWVQLPQNRNLRQPAVLTPHLMRHLYRDPKFLILVREPVERLYTAYLFHGLGHSAEEFHHDVVRGIDMFGRCLATAQDRIECFVNASVINSMPVDLHYSCYTVFFEEWLKVFPKRHFLFLRTEEYSKNLRESLLEIFKFLELPRPSVKDLQRMVQAPTSYHTKQKDVAGPMWVETRALLREWYHPWNLELAKLLKDKGYLWKDADLDT